VLYLPFTYTRRRGSAGALGAPPGADQARASAPDTAAAASEPGGAWTAPEVVAKLPGDTWQIALVVDPAGRPQVVWEEGETLRHAWRDVGGWHPSQHVAYGESPSMALDPSGGLHVLFANTFDENTEIYHSIYRDGTWTLPVNVSHTSSSFSSGPVLRAGDAQVPLVATWSEIRPEGPPLIYYAYWEGVYPWHNGPVGQARGRGPTLAVDDGSPILAWHSQAAPDRPYDIYASRAESVRGGVWSLPENVSDTPDEDSVVASVAADPRTWHVAWQEGSAGSVGVAYARRYEAGWGVVENLTQSSSGPPKVLAAPGGAREVLWLSDTAVWSARVFGEGSWQTGPIPPAGAGAVSATAAADADGGLHLVWAESQPDGTAELRYARRLGCPACRALMPLAVKNR
jgi:hypothetical protein